jgi:CubicO group peptidase (beta-lactamase class C family)
MIDEAKEYLNKCIESNFSPGYVLGIIANGRQEIIAAGKSTYDKNAHTTAVDTVYDVASITKAVPTSCLALKLLEEGRLRLDSPLIEYVPEFSGTYRDRIRIEHLLTHTLDFDFRLSDKRDLRPREILGAIFAARLRSPPGTTYSYANATSILLGLAVERASGMRLDEAASHYFFGPLGMRRTTFFPEKLDAASIAPSEIDPWRGRVICGEVHDESAWALRPVVIAGSAGLFSTVPDLVRFLAMLLGGGASGGTRIFKPDTIRLMHANALPPEFGAATALGWELNQPAFMGSRSTASTFGKTGFTGCAIVADPLRNTGFVFLTNHTFPRRREDRSMINKVRSSIADMVFGGNARSALSTCAENRLQVEIFLKTHP